MILFPPLNIIIIKVEVCLIEVALSKNTVHFSIAIPPIARKNKVIPKWHSSVIFFIENFLANIQYDSLTQIVGYFTI